MVLAVAGLSGWWYWLAGRTEQLAAEWVDQRRREGALVEHAGIRTDGFPFAVRLHVVQPKLGRVGAGWRWQWTGEAVLAEAAIWAPDRIQFRGTGTQTVTGEIGHAARPLKLEASGVFGVLQRETGRWMLRAHGYDLRLTERDVPERAITAAAANLLVGYPQPTGRLRLAVDIDTARLPEPGILGDTITYLDADMETDVPLPANETAAELSRWRDAGGRFDLARFVISYGAVRVESSGALKLDQQLRPEGQVNGRVQGWDPLVDALVTRGDVPSKSAGPAKLFLGLMARPVGPEGQPMIEAQLTAAEGQLRLGPFTLMQLHPLAR